MKVEINESGSLELTPENKTEVFALNQWVSKASVNHTHMNITTLETHHYRGSYIVIKELPE